MGTFEQVKQRQTNLFNNTPSKEFFVWVNPTNYTTFHNIHVTGQINSNPVPTGSASVEDNLLFIPNPKYKAGFVSPYHSNIVRRMRAEYWLEIYRPENYPARIHALFVCNTKDDAIEYDRIHPGHTKGRILIKGTPLGDSLYSIHDSGWFDFLCKDASIDEDTIKRCALAYWGGVKIIECKLQLYGNPWSQPPTMEVLFYGQLKVSEEHKIEIRDHFKKAYHEAPWEYPKMYL